jgi:hypothetical protein
MKYTIEQSLHGLLIEVEKLHHLDGNPRRGNLDAIIASYSEFGQVRPIVVKPNGDGTYIVIAGNHQLAAARKLGWTHIAAVQFDVEDSKAIAFALADNRTSELGHTDQALVAELIDSVVDEFPDLLDSLGWDDWEIAAMEEASLRSASTVSDDLSDEDKGIGTSFMAPVVKQMPQSDLGATVLSSLVKEDEDGEKRITAPSNVDHNEVAIKGSTVASPETAPRAVVQYTIVFDAPEQQKRWYDFIKWLRSEPAYDGDTTASKLMSFIDSHSEI